MIEIPRDEECALRSERLLLSPMLVSDAEPLFELLKEPSLYEFIGDRAPASIQVLRERIARWEHRRSPAGDEIWLNWTVRVKVDGTAVGYVQASILASRADLAWVIGLSFQGRGYATEASQTVVAWLTARLKIGELRANIHPNHAAS